MLLLQARQLLPQLAFFLSGHRHRRNLMNYPFLPAFVQAKPGIGGELAVLQCGDLLHRTSKTRFEKWRIRCRLYQSGNNLT
jgi:hypothetical protein